MLAYGMKTIKGCRQENQDDAVVLDRYAEFPDATLVGVFDGHGVNGKFASKFIRVNVPGTISRSKEFVTGNFADGLAKGLVDVNNQLKRSPDSDVTYSGSTACLALVKGSKVIVANVGDSRAVIGHVTSVDPPAADVAASAAASTSTSPTRPGTGAPSRQKTPNAGAMRPSTVVTETRWEWTAVNLSDDHRPTRPDEATRIEEAGGRIDCMRLDGEPYGPYRVYDGDKDVPGCMLTRSMGDCGVSCGVIAEPEVREYDFDPAVDKFLILATDGVWEHLSSEAAVHCVAEHIAEPNNAAKTLAEMAWVAWQAADPEGAIDDITVVIINLEATTAINDEDSDDSDGSSHYRKKKVQKAPIYLADLGFVPKTKEKRTFP